MNIEYFICIPDVITVDSKKKTTSASADEQLESQDNYS